MLQHIRLLNKSEEKVYAEINAILSDRNINARIFSKVRIADIVSISKSGIKNELYSYAMKAHFDFVITNEDTQTLFVIEFDGPTHLSSEQKHKDAKKMSICKYFDIPILKINDKYLNGNYRGKKILLNWIIDAYFTQQAFLNDKECKNRDFFFDPMMIISDHTNIHWPFQLALDARNTLLRLYQGNKIKNPCASGYIGYTQQGIKRGFKIIQVADDNYIYVESGMQEQFFPLDLSDLLFEILTLDLEKEVEKFIQNSGPSMSLVNAREKMKKIFSSTSLLTSFSGGQFTDIFEELKSLHAIK